MLTLLKNMTCYTPQHIGLQDVLIAGEKIIGVSKPGTYDDIPVSSGIMDQVIDGTGLQAFPGLIDQHVHITGGGGEEGFGSKISELRAEDLITSGITTIVGLLGADGMTRSMESLFAKAKSLEDAGLTTYIYSGSYTLPPVTLTGSLCRDIVLVDKVIGVGEIAVSDHRSSNPDGKMLADIASQVHLGGLLSGKAGVLHLHIGDGKPGLKPLMDCLNISDLPVEMFVPTHVNRNYGLFQQAIDYCLSGGYIDLTAGELQGITVPAAVSVLLERLPDLSHVTVSSDGGGSTPSGTSALPKALYQDFSDILLQMILTPDQAISLFTENVARLLKLFPRKGVLQPGGDADILAVDAHAEIRMVFGRGRLLLDRR